MVTLEQITDVANSVKCLREICKTYKRELDRIEAEIKKHGIRDYYGNIDEFTVEELGYAKGKLAGAVECKKTMEKYLKKLKYQYKEEHPES